MAQQGRGKPRPYTRTGAGWKAGIGRGLILPANCPRINFDKCRRMTEVQIKKPSLINQLIPWVITLAIFVWLYYNIDFRKMFQILAEVRLGWFIPSMAGFVLVFGAIDTFTYGQSYSWFTARLTTREKIELRVGPYVVQPIFAPLAEVLFPLYLWRRKGVSPAHALSTSVWTMMSDLAALFTALTIGVLYNLKTRLAPQIGFGWLLAMIIFWAVYFGNLIFWHSRLQLKIAAWVERSRNAGAAQQGASGILLKVAAQATQLLRTFSIARWRHYLYIYALRILMVFAGLISNYVALKALGLEVPVAIMVIGIPIIFYSHFQPINVGGYGGPQALAILFLYEIGHCGSKEQVAAFSFLWSTGFLVGRILLGMVFIRGFWKNTFPEGFGNWRRGAGG